MVWSISNFITWWRKFDNVCPSCSGTGKGTFWGKCNECKGTGKRKPTEEEVQNVNDDDFQKLLSMDTVKQVGSGIMAVGKTGLAVGKIGKRFFTDSNNSDN